MITRFAPSPTGPLHLGHAYSALLAHDIARQLGGRFLLRIEDIDRSRARSEWERQIYDDLHWLGLHWPEPAKRQSERAEAYRSALERLWHLGLIYPCTCNRADIRAALSAPQEGAPVRGPDGLIYPGTCRPNTRQRPSEFHIPTDGVLRLDMARAASTIGVAELSYQETGDGAPDQHNFSPQHLIATVGDVVLARRDLGTSYHLAVVVDDAAQQVTHVVRGRDLAEATPIHVLLQRLLDLPTPVYHHHRLIRDEYGKRLAKRDDARAIRLYRAEGRSPAEIRTMVGLTPSAT